MGSNGLLVADEEEHVQTSRHSSDRDALQTVVLADEVAVNGHVVYEAAL